MVEVTLLLPATRFATWHFDGFDTPALDVVLDEKVPTVRGSLAIPSTRRIAGSGTVVTPDVNTIVDFYRRQGLTANDLLKMNAQDAVDRVPVATIHARSEAPATTSSPNTRLRGTVVPVSAARTIDNTAVPAEPPP